MGVAMDEHLGSIVSIASACPPRLAFMGRLLASTSFSSVTIAVMFGQIGTSLSIGPLVPAMVGGWLGYTWGLLKFWESEATRAKAYARDYPALMRYALAYAVQHVGGLHVDVCGSHKGCAGKVRAAS